MPAAGMPNNRNMPGICQSLRADRIHQLIGFAHQHVNGQVGALPRYRYDAAAFS